MFAIKILSFIALLGSIAWYIYDPGFEPAIAIITSLTALIAAWVSDNQRNTSSKQSQKVGDKSFGIQAGGGVNVGDIDVKRKSSDVE